eukprot:9468677-Pyramimonas_sp.AAC.2
MGFAGESGDPRKGPTQMRLAPRAYRGCVMAQDGAAAAAVLRVQQAAGAAGHNALCGGGVLLHCGLRGGELPGGRGN